MSTSDDHCSVHYFCSLLTWQELCESCRSYCGYRNYIYLCLTPSPATLLLIVSPDCTSQAVLCWFCSRILSFDLPFALMMSLGSWPRFSLTSSQNAAFGTIYPLIHLPVSSFLAPQWPFHLLPILVRRRSNSFVNKLKFHTCLKNLKANSTIVWTDAKKT